jgi:phosphoribosyl 1,2-cyclic phosphodiesterase
MKVSLLASSSKGNSTFIEEEDTRILIDLGVSCNYIESKLKELDIDPASINAILITHAHADHICGLARFYKKYKTKIYIMPRVINDMKRIVGEFDYQLFNDNITEINNLNLNIIRTSHDAIDSIGFLINNKLVYITDTGYLNTKYFKLLENKEAYVLESNHDIEMLMNNKYPYYLKQRILGDKGHLSNRMASQYLSKLIGSNTKHIILAHLSEENNNPDKALETLFSYIDKDKVNNIVVAKPHDKTELINI